MASSPISRLHHLHWASVHRSCLHVWSELEFWRTHCGFSISTCCFSCLFRTLEAASFLQPQEPSLLLHTFLLQFPHLSAFTELRRVGVLFCIRLWLPRMWLAWSNFLYPNKLFYPDCSNFLLISSKTVSWSYQCVYWSSAFNFIQELFLCIHSSDNRYSRPLALL